MPILNYLFTLIQMIIATTTTNTTATAANIYTIFLPIASPIEVCDRTEKKEEFVT